MASFALSPSYTPSLLDPPSLPEDGIRALMLFLAFLRLLIIFLLRSSIWVSSLISIVGGAALLFLHYCCVPRSSSCFRCVCLSLVAGFSLWNVAFVLPLYLSLFFFPFFHERKILFWFSSLLAFTSIHVSFFFFSFFSLFAWVFLSFLLSPFIRTMSNLKDGVVCCRKNTASCVSGAANLLSGGGGGRGVGGLSSRVWISFDQRKENQIQHLKFICLHPARANYPSKPWRQYSLPLKDSSSS